MGYPGLKEVVVDSKRVNMVVSDEEMRGRVGQTPAPPQGHGFATATLILTPPFRIQNDIHGDPSFTSIPRMISLLQEEKIT